MLAIRPICPDGHSGGGPVVITPPDDVQRSYAMHANAYIVKPAGFDGFEDVVKRIDACFLGLIQLPPG